MFITFILTVTRERSGSCVPASTTSTKKSKVEEEVGLCLLTELLTKDEECNGFSDLECDREFDEQAMLFIFIVI